MLPSSDLNFISLIKFYHMYMNATFLKHTINHATQVGQFHSQFYNHTHMHAH